MSASCSSSTIKREHTGEIPFFHLHLHPLGNEYWPCLFDEIIDMLDMSMLCYWVGDLRKLVKEKKLTDEATVNALFQMPSTFNDLSGALEKNHDFLSIHQKRKQVFNFYANTLKELSKRYSEISANASNHKLVELLHFEDEIEGKFGGPVYAFSINHVRKRICIGFRGSKTAKDFMCDWKTALSNIPNPLEDEARSGGDFIQVHHGFKEYLYDLSLESENSEGVLERQSLISHLLTEVAKVFEEYPDYRLYTTGHSLGAALATLFAMEAGASKDPRIRKPVTCITFASPRVGNLSFARTFKKLEKSRRVRCVRILNDGDLIPEIPATAHVNCLLVTCCQGKVYRHVGISCQLHSDNEPLITYPLYYNHPVRLFLSDSRVQMRRISRTIYEAPLIFARRTNLASNHSCKQYYKRLRQAEDCLKKLHLNEVYGDLYRAMAMDMLSEASSKTCIDDSRVGT